MRDLPVSVSFLVFGKKSLDQLEVVAAALVLPEENPE